ncbi:MAG: cobalamin-binding protein [Sulfuricella sp.]|nr:cobalamin-binding protein [Sulfuricella sp.]
MKPWYRWFFTAAGLSLLPSALAGAAPLTVRDDRGVEVVLAAPARRIVTLAPNLAELAYAAGAGERLVGVSTASDYPPQVKDLPQLGYGRFDMERLVQLKPDLVLAWESGNSALEVALLARLGIPLYVAEARRPEDIPRHIEAIGRLAGSAAPAQRSAMEFRRTLAELTARYAHASPLTVFLEIWHQPLMTVTDRHLIGGMVRLCGGTNPFGSLAPLLPTLALESVLAADPQVIVTSLPSNAPWQRYPAMQAVRSGNVKTINPDYLQRATPRTLEGVRQLCELLDEARR